MYYNVRAAASYVPSFISYLLCFHPALSNDHLIHAYVRVICIFPACDPFASLDSHSTGRYACFTDITAQLAR